MNKLISFIIPIYNCEKYITTCLYSISNLMCFKNNFEVILINDGSTDNSETIIKSFTYKKNNFRLVKQNNLGASSARNAGLKVAQGKYIWFVDADDKINPFFLKKILEFISSDDTYELFCFNHYKETNSKLVPCFDYSSEKTINGLEFYKNRPSGFLWNKIYKRSSIGQNLFLDGTKNLEDFYFNTKVVIKLKKILLLTDFGYYYNTTNLLSTSRNLNPRNLVKLKQDTITIHQAIINDINKNNDIDTKTVLIDNLNISIAGHLYSIVRFYSPSTLKKVIKMYCLLGVYPISYTSNPKANLFITIANRKYFFFRGFKFFYHIKHKK